MCFRIEANGVTPGRWELKKLFAIEGESHTNTGTNKYGYLGIEYILRWGTIWPINPDSGKRVGAI